MENDRKEYKEDELVSIIVPVYNLEEYVRECIESILAQTYTNLDIILINDGSVDGSSEIIKSYLNRDSRIRFFEKENGGLTSTRNYGLERAHGQWIMHVDGDDWIDPEMVESLLRTAYREKADVVISGLRFVFPSGIKEYKAINARLDKENFIKLYIASVWTTLCATIQKKELYENNALRSAENISYCEDFHLMARLLLCAKRIASTNQIFYNYRQIGNSITHKMNEETQNDELWAYSDIIGYFKGYGVYENYKREMAWRVLKATQDWALSEEDVEKFLEYNLKNRRYIISCPYLGFKLKVISWMHTYGSKGMGLLAIRTRNKILGWRKRQ